MLNKGHLELESYFNISSEGVPAKSHNKWLNQLRGISFNKWLSCAMLNAEFKATHCSIRAQSRYNHESSPVDDLCYIMSYKFSEIACLIVAHAEHSEQKSDLK